MYLFLILAYLQTYNSITFTPVEVPPITQYIQTKSEVENTVPIDNLVTIHNDYRTSNGLSVFTVDSKLNSSAQAKADDMCEKNYWEHMSPDGIMSWHLMTQAGYRYDRAGENLARNFLSDQTMFDAWLNSPTHLANIIGDYKNIGIGRNYCGGINYIVVHFGTLVGE